MNLPFARDLYLEIGIQIRKEFPKRYATDFPKTLLTVEYASLLEHFRASRELLFEQLCKANNIEYIPVPKS